MHPWAIRLTPLLLGTASGYVSRFGPYWDAQRTSNIPCQPPGAAFSIVWPILYLMMGHAAALTKDEVKWSHPALFWFGVQLGINLAWAPLNTYVYRADLMFFMTLVTLVAATVATMKMANVSSSAGLWMAPYLVWLTFALSLSRSRWAMEMAIR